MTVRQDEVCALADKRKMYVLVRSDLPPGLRAAQAGHAIADLCLTGWPAIDRWHEDDDGNYLIILEVADEDALRDWHRYFARRGVALGPEFREPDLGGRVTAFAALPQPHQNALFSGLPLAYAKRSWWRRLLRRR